MSDNKDIKLFSGGTYVLLILMLLGTGAGLYRLAVGLGGATNLNDDFPWGLWIGMDVMMGVALAAGGFTIAAAVYILNLKKFRPIVRPAILTAFIGYLLVIAGLFFDIGKPFSFWHPLVMWQNHSIMFEIVWCITLYTVVLSLEFAPAYLEKYKITGALKALRALMFPIVIAGILLSYFHQSSLGALFLITPEKTPAIWWSTRLPQLFFLSAIACGLAMVSVEMILSSKAFKKEPEQEILSGLAKASMWTLLFYFFFKITDIAANGALDGVFTGERMSAFFLIEIIVGVVVPMLLLASQSVRNSAESLLMVQGLVIFGVFLNRFNINFFTQATDADMAYFPSIGEFLITVGLIAAGIFMYRAAVVYLPIIDKAESEG